MFEPLHKFNIIEYSSFFIKGNAKMQRTKLRHECDKNATTLKMDNFVAIKNIQQRSDFALCFATDGFQTTAGAVHEESEF